MGLTNKRDSTTKSCRRGRPAPIRRSELEIVVKAVNRLIQHPLKRRLVGHKDARVTATHKPAHTARWGRAIQKVVVRPPLSASAFLSMAFQTLGKEARPYAWEITGHQYRTPSTHLDRVLPVLGDSVLHDGPFYNDLPRIVCVGVEVVNTNEGQ